MCGWKFCCRSVTKLCPTLCDLMNCSKPGFPVLHYLPEFAQTHVHWVGDTIWPSYPLLPSSPLALNFSQHQSLFQWVGPSHQSIGAPKYWSFNFSTSLSNDFFRLILSNYFVCLLSVWSRFLSKFSPHAFFERVRYKSYV